VMIAYRVLVVLLVLVCSIQCETKNRPLVVAHRGTPSHRVEETFPSYELAVSYQADFIESDLCVTSDRVLVLRHECNLDETTDVADHPEFADRQKRAAYGRRSLNAEATGWYTENFTLAEIRTLRTKERLSEDVRTHAYDRLYQIITLDEFLQNALALRGQKSFPPSPCGESSEEAPTPIGVYIETKTPAYFKAIMPDFDFEGAVLSTLEKFGYKERCEQVLSLKDSDPHSWVKQCGVILQSFENNLASLENCPYPRVQLLENDGVQPDTGKLYTDLMTDQELTKIKEWAVGIGPAKDSCLNYTTYTSTGLIERAHSVGLMVHPYTFRPEPYYMKGAFDDNPTEEFYAFFDLGVDGVFTDSCDIAYSAVNDYYYEPSEATNILKYFFYALTSLVIVLFVVGVFATVVIYLKRRSSKKYESFE